jgi:hypothetical protein
VIPDIEMTDPLSTVDSMLGFLGATERANDESEVERRTGVVFESSESEKLVTA